MLKKRQKEILSIIKKEPNITLEEIASKLDLKSVSNIHAHVQKLIEQGYIKKSGRSLIVKNTNDDPISYIPFFGYAQCGYNGCFNEDDDVLDYIPMPTRFLPANIDDLIAMKAKGDSMEPNIQEEDILLFDKSQSNCTPKENDILLCNIDGELKIKRFVIKQNKKLLISDNKTHYDPIELDESNNFNIIGKIVKMRG
jgi:repressor LexA